MKETIQELGYTETPDVRGNSFTAYGLSPVEFVTEIVDAAKKQLFFTNFAKQIHLPKGVKSVSVPRKIAYKGYANMTWNTAGSDTGGTGAGVGPYANTVAEISWTSLDNNTAVQFTPLPYMAGYAIRRYDLDTNALNLLEDAKNELSYAIGDRVDTIMGLAFGTGALFTLAQSGTAGKIQLYAGTATSDATLVNGNILTPDLIATAARYLKGKENWYRASGSGQYGTLTYDSTTVKNPWQNTADEPFVMFIGPAQEEALRKDSQFTNAAEYGSQRVVMNGEIGEYLGIKIVVTTNTESVAASGTGPDSTTVDAGLTYGMTRCVLMKAYKAIGVAWGQEPEVKVFEFPSYDQLRIALYTAYDIKAIQSDAVVCVDVSNG